MARLRPAFVGALILVLAALFGQGRPILAGGAGLGATPIEVVEADGFSFVALAALGLQSEDDPDELTDPAEAGDGLASGRAFRLPQALYTNVTPRRALPRSTGPPADCPGA